MSMFVCLNSPEWLGRFDTHNFQTFSKATEMSVNCESFC